MAVLVNNLGFYTLPGTWPDCQTHAAREVVRVLKGEPPLTPVNDPWLVGEQAETGFGGV